MVEVNPICRGLCAGVLAAVAVGLFGAFAQSPEARIAGLENNEEYMSLLREDAQLQLREDSIVGAVERLRVVLREDPEQRSQHARRIMELEERIFALRSEKGRLVDRINTIEQDWVLANLNAAPPTAGPTTAEVPESLKVRSLIDNVCFREGLPENDYAALRRAQRLELRAVECVNRFFANRETALDLVAAYAAALNEAEALEIAARFEAVEGANDTLADSLAGIWNYVYDNKTYAFDYLMEKYGAEELLRREEERRIETARAVEALRGRTASDAVADYFLRKEATVGYETAVAEFFGLDAARDSLRGVAKQLAQIDFRVPRPVLEERSFIEYDSIQIVRTPRYTYQNPIPECRMYAHGTVYRILLGTFNTKRAASTFRGAVPLCYRIDEEGKWCYYAGAFATRDEAEAAQQQMKRAGFLRPEIVVWTDGEYRNITREPGSVRSYRVEIVGAEQLSEAMKELIGSLEGGVELSRAGDGRYVVGPFAEREAADAAVSALEALDRSSEIKTVEIAE